MRDLLKDIPWGSLLVVGLILALTIWSPVEIHELPPDTPWPC